MTQKAESWWRSSRPLSVEELRDALGRAGRNEAPGLLFDLWVTRRVDHHALREVLFGAWSMAEWPCRILPASCWLAWFRLAKYPQPGGALPLYRGADRHHARGMSWTSDRERAEWFAARNRDFWPSREFYNWTAMASPAAILADIDALEPDGRGEGEIVVDPRLLPRLKRL